MSASSDRPSIAVLPFRAEGEPGGDRCFSDGVTEDIVTELSRFRELLVVGHSSSFPLESGPVEGVAAALGVRYVLQGAIRRSPTRIRISSHLVDARVGSPIWTDRQDASPGDLLDLQEAVASRIAGSLVPEIEQAEWRRAEVLPRTNMAAYELALRAGAAIARGVAGMDKRALSDGIGLAQDAVGIDPACRRALYALAWGYCRRGVLDGIGAEGVADLDRADAAALALRDLDPADHAAYAILGHVAMRRLRHDEAASSLRRANALNPNDIVTLRWLSWQESNLGQADAAAAQAGLSLRLGPRDRAIDLSHWALGLAAYVGADPAAGVRHAREAIGLNRRHSGHYLLLAACLAETGQLAEAHGVAEQLRRSHPGLLRSRLSGRSYFADPGLAERYRRALLLAARGPARSAATVLTRRELEVLQLVAGGAGNGRIAVALGLSEHTVKRHVANILTKLGLPTRAAAVATAARMGLLPTQP